MFEVFDKILHHGELVADHKFNVADRYILIKIKGIKGFLIKVIPPKTTCIKINMILPLQKL